MCAPREGAAMHAGSVANQGPGLGSFAYGAS